MTASIFAMTSDDVVASARSRSGLSDLGDEAFLEVLPAFLAGLREQADQISDSGARVLRFEVVGAVEKRLRIQEYLRQHPDAGDAPVTRPIVITGLYRSGTSRLQELLCADPNLRCLTQWQTVTPTPTGDERPGEDDPRIAIGQLGLDMLAELSPHAVVAHPLTARSPSEEFPLMTPSFRVLDAKHIDTSFSSWIVQQDNGAMYEDLRRALQVLQHQDRWRGGAEHRYCLKAPVHLGNLDLLLEAFPDAKVLITHREPFPAIHSFAMVRESLRGMYSDDIDPMAVGTDILAQASRALERSVEVRPALPADRVLDLPFTDVVHRLPDRLDEIYAFLDAPLTDDVRAALQIEEQRRDEHRSRAQPKDPSVYGLTRERVEATTPSYRAFADAEGLSTWAPSAPDHHTTNRGR